MAHTVADLEGLQADPTPDETFTMTSHQWRLAVVVELVLGAILGSLFLGTHGLFLDESVSATLATAPWHRFVNVVTHREANMALYYLLLRGWVVFGHSEIALRSLGDLALERVVGRVIALFPADRLDARSALEFGVQPLDDELDAAALILHIAGRGDEEA